MTRTWLGNVAKNKVCKMSQQPVAWLIIFAAVCFSHGDKTRLDVSFSRHQPEKLYPSLLSLKHLVLAECLVSIFTAPEAVPPWEISDLRPTATRADGFWVQASGHSWGDSVLRVVVRWVTSEWLFSCQHSEPSQVDRLTRPLFRQLRKPVSSGLSTELCSLSARLCSPSARQRGIFC